LREDIRAFYLRASEEALAASRSTEQP
jgi:hypothetical protein